MKKISVVTLGCPKNTVDSENMSYILQKEGFMLTEESEEADVILINTCSFINDAKVESINAILQAGEIKKKTNCKIMVTGCLAQRYEKELYDEIPEVDAFIGTGRFYDVAEFIKKLDDNERIVATDNINCPIKEEKRILSTPSYYAYVKLAEGCDKKCTYCVIPKLRGKQRSRKIEDVLTEVNELVNNGVREIILIAQDVGEYGRDIYGKRSLADLLDKLCKINDLKWIRLMYVYPETVSDELIEVIAREEKILNYLDIPFQHINDDILKLMGRKTSKKEIINIINKLRNKIPDVRIRSSFITGFPNETDKEHEELIDFLKEYHLDRVGFFPFSREEGSGAYNLENQVEEEVKQLRFNELMEVQMEISEKNLEQLINKEIEVLIEEEIEQLVYSGRSRWDAPEIDGVIYVYSDFPLEIGEFYNIKVNDTMEYDVIGEIKK